jgi:hypothetical protein
MEDVANGGVNAVSVERLDVWNKEDLVGYGRIDRPLPHAFLVDRNIESEQVPKTGPKTGREESLLGSHTMLNEHTVEVLAVYELLKDAMLEHSELLVRIINIVLTMEEPVS